MSQKKLFSRPLYIFTILMTLFSALPLLFITQQAWGQNNIDLDINQLLQDPAFKAEFDKLSPAEQQSAVQEIDKMMNQLQNMKPEDWEKVDQMATAMEAELEKRGGLENMSDDEFNQFFNDFATEWEAKEKAAEYKPATPEKKKEEKPKKVDIKAVSEKEQLLNNISAIIKSIDSFVAKANSIPELAGNVQNWVKNGAISGWPAGTTWNAIKKAIQSLHQKLELAITTDKKTTERRYLDYIFEDQALVKAIADLKNTLTVQEPLVDVHAFGLEPLSKQSKDATKKVLNSLGAAINAGALEGAIDKALTKHEPTTQKSREQEEKARKAAEQESQRKPGMKPAVQTPGIAGGYSDYGSYDSSYGSDYGDYYGGSDYSSYTPSSSRSSSRSAGYTDRETGARGQRAGGTPGSKEAKKDEKKEKKEEPKKVIPEPTTAQDKNINTLVARFEENIDRAVELIEDESVLETLEKNKDKASKPAIPAGQPVKADKVSKVENMLSEEIESDLAHFITTAAASINELYYNVTDTAFYKKHIESVMKKPKTKLDPVIKALQAQYEKAEKEYDAQVTKLEAQKNALVMSEGAGEEVEKQKALIAQQQALIDVQIQTLAKPTASGVVKAYNMLNKAISRFEKTKEKPSTSKKK